MPRRWLLGVMRGVGDTQTSLGTLRCSGPTWVGCTRDKCASPAPRPVLRPEWFKGQSKGKAQVFLSSLPSPCPLQPTSASVGLDSRNVSLTTSEGCSQEGSLE